MKISSAPLSCDFGLRDRMLSDERTTHEELPAPREVEGLVVAPGRAVMRSLVGFLRGEGINVRTVADAEGAFEEALLHPPDDPLHAERPAAGEGAGARGGRRRGVRAGDGHRGAQGAHVGAAADARALPAHRSAAAVPAERDRRSTPVAVAFP